MEKLKVHEHADSMEDFVALLKSAHVRITSQREKFIEWAVNQKQGFTIHEAVNDLSSNGIGQASVYRIVHLFLEMGIIKRISHTPDEHRFRLTCPGHHHLIICDRCGYIQEFDSCGWEMMSKLLKLETGFTALNHEIEVHGICGNCQ